MPEPEPALPAGQEIRPAEPEPAEPQICPAEPEPEPSLPAELQKGPAEPQPALPAQPAPERVLQPELELLNGNEYFKICMPLHNAALEGNWEAAKEIIENHSQTSLTTAIARGGFTILHVAVGARKRTFVEKLLDSVKRNDDLMRVLQKHDEKGNNAFCFAAVTGDVEIAKLMLKKNPDLQNVRGSKNVTPLHLAVVFGQKDMANFLYPGTNLDDSLRQNEIKDLFIASINADLYGITLKLLGDPKYPNEIWGRQAEAQDRNESGIGETALHLLAQKPNLKTKDALKLVKLLWESLTSSHTSNQVKDLIINMLFDAAKLGNFEFIAIAVHFYPDLIYEFDENKLSIFHLGVQYRHVKIFDLINMMGFHGDLLSTYVDKDRNNILHLAAKYPNPPPAKIVPGAALELQQEILMFEEVERIFPPAYRDQKNGTCNTPKQLFTETHKDLRKRGEEWMKSTANSCMLVATLIATVAFAAAFTVPGGNHQDIGKPILLHNNFFKVFAVSDAIALFSSSISILMFLSILTSRYEEKDFRMRLPLKLMFGLLAIFISIITMTLAFTSGIFLLYSERWNGITGLSFALILVAACLYLVLHFSLLKDIVHSTFCFRRSTFCSRNQIKTKCLLV